jgi:hypothetical protein
MGDRENSETESYRTGWDFFVSYTQADQTWAEWISWQLEAAGYRVLVQAWDMVPGSHWSASMQNGVQYSQRTIAVVSQAYLSSVFGEAEWEAAWRDDPRGSKRKLIPVRVEDCPRPGLLGAVISIDLFDLSIDAAREFLLKKIEVVQVGRAKPTAEPMFPGPQAPEVPRPSVPPVFPGPLSRAAKLPTSFGSLRIRALHGRAQIFIYASQPRVLLDDQEHVITWGENELRVTPGRHDISVYFPYSGFDRCCIASTVIEVPPDETIEIEYRTPFWMTSPGKLRVTHTGW